jgi:hypothetical protein
LIQVRTTVELIVKIETAWPDWSGGFFMRGGDGTCGTVGTCGRRKP